MSRLACRNFAAAALAALTMHVAQAALIDRGGGMIYDTELNITWLADANYAKTSGFSTFANGRMSFDMANAWVESLVYGGFDDWRLPKTLVPDPSCGSGHPVFTSLAQGLGCSGSEMGHLHYKTFGATVNLRGGLQGQEELANLALFSNIQGGDTYFPGPELWFGSADPYWSGTGFADVETGQKVLYSFNFSSGSQSFFCAYCGAFYVWPVRDGDVATTVPEPGTLALFGLGIAGLAFTRRRKQ